MEADQMRIIGIDPGIKGGLAYYNGTTMEAIATPTVTTIGAKNKKKADYDVPAIAEWIKQFSPDGALIELVHAMPKQGVSSTFFFFFFGKGFGILIGVCGGLGIPVLYSRPQEWKGYHDLIGADKNGSLDLARELWPDKVQECFRLKKHDGVAEAALIAKYGFDKGLFS